MNSQIVSFGCMHAVGMALLGFEKTTYIGLPCGGRIDLSTLLMPLAEGSAGSLLLSCSPSECRHRSNDTKDCKPTGAELVSKARQILSLAGFSPKRIAHRTITPGIDDPIEIIESFSKQIHELGTLSQGDLFDSDEPPEWFAADRCVRIFASLQALRAGSSPFVPKAGGKDLLWLGCADIRSLALGPDFPNFGHSAADLWSCGPSGESINARCCGAPLLESGNERAFLSLAKENAKIIERSGAKRIVTACVQCTKTFGEIYPRFDINLSVPVIDLAQWAVESFDIKPENQDDPMGFLQIGQESKQMEAVMSFYGNIFAFHWPEQNSDSQGKISFGPTFRSAVSELSDFVSKNNIKALIVPNPHRAAEIRAALPKSGWQTRGKLPIVDVSRALLSLVKGRKEGSQ